MSMRLTLIIPELIWPDPDAGVLADVDCPALATLLTRSQGTRHPAESLEAALTGLFNQAPTVSHAALRRAGETKGIGEDPVAGERPWLCGDPVHLRFHQDHLILADSASFGITIDEADALVATLNTELGERGRFAVGGADRWYLQLADAGLADGLDTPPLSTVTGRSIACLLNESAAGKGLRHLLNEAQMVLHAHPINEQRERAGRLPINGLWLWGAGSPPAHVDSDFDGVWTGSALARGLGRCAGVPTHALPADSAVLFDHAARDTDQLVVIDDPLAPVQYQNGSDYRAAIASLETRWFAPLQKALAAGRVRTLRIVAPTAYGVLAWDIKRSDCWKLWRRPQALAALAKELAKNE